jgi:cytochrome c oxidase cbb3-type subunit 3
MNARTRIGLLASLAMAGAAPAVAQTSDAAATPAKPEAPAPAPPGAAASHSPELVAKGDALFHGSGNCYACHGSKGEGLVGPNLTDAEWIHSKGSEDDVKAVAAYVYSLSHK